jgi:hypothetical protein
LPSPFHVVRIFLRTAVVDDTLPPPVFCTLRCALCPTLNYCLDFYYRQGSSGGLTNDHNDNNEGATARVPLPTLSGDNDAAPPDHLLRSRYCLGGGVAMPALQICWGVNDGKKG